MSQINYTDTKHWLRTARTLTEALPYMQKYAGRRFVIKYGGHAMGDAGCRASSRATSCCCARSAFCRSWSMAAARRSTRC